MFVDCTALLSDLDPDKWTPEQLDKVAEALIAKALGSESSPAAVADVKRRLEAGETVYAVCEDITEPGIRCHDGHELALGAGFFEANGA